MDDQFDSLKSSTVVLVDDEPTTVEILEMFLKGEGYAHVVTVTDSSLALGVLADAGADLLLLDLHMPEPDGFEVLRQIRDDEKLRQLPVIMLTAATDAQTKLQALELGVTDFLNKPVDPSELALRLRNTLGSKAYQDRLTYYDGATGLPNRRMLMERLDAALTRDAERPVRGALFHIQLDGFHRVNDNLGQPIGDQLLRAAGKRIRSAVAEASGGSSGTRLLARIGTDDFALFMPGIASATDANEVARRILHSLTRGYRSRTREIFVASRVGIALCPDHGRQIETLLRNARMCNVKRSSANGSSIFDAALAEEARRQFKLETEIRGAIGRGEMMLHYQPRVEIGSGEVTGVEALLRWEHPELGVVPTPEFLPIGEEANVLHEIGSWVIHQACEQSRLWQAAGLPPILMSFNVSDQQLEHEDTLSALRSALDDSGVDPGFLLLELTEADLMRDPDATARTLRRIAEMNLSISIDGFGAGHSALSILTALPVDELKIARSFVETLPENADSAAIIKAIVAMAHSLGLGVAATGVEREGQLNLLRTLGVDQYQGHLFAEAVPPERIAELLRAH